MQFSELDSRSMFFTDLVYKEIWWFVTVGLKQSSTLYIYVRKSASVSACQSVN